MPSEHQTFQKYNPAETVTWGATGAATKGNKSILKRNISSMFLPPPPSGLNVVVPAPIQQAVTDKEHASLRVHNAPPSASPLVLTDAKLRRVHEFGWNTVTKRGGQSHKTIQMQTQDWLATRQARPSATRNHFVPLSSNVDNASSMRFTPSSQSINNTTQSLDRAQNQERAHTQARRATGEAKKGSETTPTC